MDATGIILAGGKSKRMKLNKAFVTLNDQPIIEIIMDKFIRYFAETIIISNDPELYQGYGIKVYQDVYPGLGPVSGIHAGLTYAQTEGVFVAACDIPFIKMELVDYMLKRLDKYQTVAVNIDGYPQATAAVYRKDCRDIFTRCIQEDKLKAGWIFRELNTLILEPEDLAWAGNVKEIFYNINNEADLEYARELARRYLE